ncbi:MAG: nucleoside triphosphate pyrophosphohydrolase [Chloroflexota bacterium]
MTGAPRGGAAIDAYLSAARAAGIDLDRGVAAVPLAALSTVAIDPRLPLLVVPLAPQPAAADGAGGLPGRRGHGVGLLVRLYGAAHEALLLPSGERVALSRLDEALQRVGADAALAVPPLAPLAALASPWAMPWLSARLRAADGCPWDREQTHGSLAKHLIEEAWELHDAIEALEAASADERPAALQALAGELGDVLLQVVLHAQIAEEAGAFDLTDVQERLAAKIVRRHPHVFGDAEAKTVRDVQRNWEATKARERAAAGDAGSAGGSAQQQGALDGVSRGLPALAASRELQDRASAVGYDWPTLGGVREKIAEELAELDEALAAAGNPDVVTGVAPSGAAALAAAKDELGDVLAVIVNLGRRSGIDAEAALRGANDKFRRRFGEVERRAAARGISLREADFATLDALWDEAKAHEASARGARATE